MNYRIDEIKVCDDFIIMQGWVVGDTENSKANFILKDNNKLINIELERIRRDDVCAKCFKDTSAGNELGFKLNFPYTIGQKLKLYIECDGKTAKVDINNTYIKVKKLKKKAVKLKSLMTLKILSSGMKYLVANGPNAFVRRMKRKISNMTDNYDEWYAFVKPNKEELEEQRKKVFEFTPKISIVIPAYKTPEKYLKELIESVQEQTYSNWELCFADGSPLDEGIISLVEKYAKGDSRIKCHTIGKNLGIAGNTNEALEMATGDFIALVDHDDTIVPEALYECVKAINNNVEIDVLYSDEDKISMEDGSLFEPHFKPDFNIDLLRSVNYICHLFVVSRNVLNKVGGFRAEFDGAQDYDFILRCTEKADNIYHIAKVLYHWRCHKNSTAANPESKLYAFKAGARAIEAHYERVGIEATIENGISYGIYRTKYKLKEKPLVSIIIPTKDHSVDLDKCVKSLMLTGYENLEFIIVENNSTDEETFRYYEKLKSEYKNVKVVIWEREFNYSAINNFGVEHASGEYLLFINNDTEVIEKKLFEELLGYGMRDDVGIVGTRLLYSDDTMQHAGVVIGFGGIAGHTFIGLGKGESSYFNRALCAQNYSAVTAACMLSKKSLFNQVGGFTEELAVAFNDIDYCMKIRELGKLVVYNPYAVLYHYESKSRGLEDTPEKVARFNREIDIFARRWPEILRSGDPYYNRNLTLDKSDFSLKD
jgi:Predicted glycosyltransferases